MSGVNEGTMKITVDGFEDEGFIIGSINIKSSVLLLPNSFFLWKPRTVDEITVESLLLPTLITPKIEMLIIGKGERNVEPLAPELLRYFKEKGIVVEHMSTSHALATYNVLTSEDRNVAAALLTIVPTDKENGAIAANMEEYMPEPDEDPFRLPLPDILDATPKANDPTYDPEGPMGLPDPRNR